AGAGGADPADARYVPRVPGHGEVRGGRNVAAVAATSEAQAIPSRRLRAALALVAILLVAAGLRLYRLDTFPPGVYSDVALNGLDWLQHGLQVLYQPAAAQGIGGISAGVGAGVRTPS